MLLIPQPSIQSLASEIYELKMRLQAYERIAIQMLEGGRIMASYLEEEIANNPIIRAREAGRKAGLAGESDVVPPDFRQRDLQAIAWSNGYEAGKRARRHKDAR